MSPMRRCVPLAHLLAAYLLAPVRRFASWLDAWLVRRFAAGGRLCATHPVKVIVVLCAAVALSGTGMRFNAEGPIEVVWTPEGSPSRAQLVYMRENYGFFRGSVALAVASDLVDASSGKIKDPSAAAGSDEPGTNLLTKPILLRLLDLHEKIISTAVDVKTEDGVPFEESDEASSPEPLPRVAYNDTCFRPFVLSACYVHSVLSLWDFDAQKIRDDPDILGTVALDDKNADFLGAVTRDTSTGRIRSAGALIVAYVNRDSTSAAGSAKVMSWEEMFLQTVAEDSDPAYTLFRYTRRSQRDEVQRATGEDTILFVIAGATMLVYCAIALGSRSLVQSRVLLGLGGVVCVAFSIVMGFGIGGYMGLPYSVACIAVPFLILGVGVDDMFIIVHAYDREAGQHDSIKDQVAAAMAAVGSSITMTSVTDFIAFAVGSNSLLPALHGFCGFAAICILCDFLLQVTLFVALLTLNQRRVRANRLDLLPCLPAERFCPARAAAADAATDNDSLTAHAASARSYSPASSDSSDAERRPRDASDGGSSSGSDEDGPTNREDSEAIVVLEPSAARGTTLSSVPSAVTEHRTFVGRIIYNYFAPFLLKKWTKVGVLVFCLLFAAFSIFGMFQLGSGLSNSDVLPGDSYLLNFFEAENEYFAGYNSKVDLVFTGFFDYADEANQDTIMEVTALVNGSEWVRPEFTHSWLANYLTWLGSSWHSGQLSPRGRPQNKRDFYLFLFEYLTTVGQQHADDLVLQYGQIKTSRIRMQHITLDTDMMRADAILEMRNMTAIAMERSGGVITCFPFTMQYIFWEQFINLVPRNALNFLLVGVSIYLLTFAFLGDAVLALIVILCVVLVDVDMLGVMYLWNIDLNNVALTNMLLALGLAVDSVAHVTHSVVAASTAEDEQEEQVGQELQRLLPTGSGDEDDSQSAGSGSDGDEMDDGATSPRVLSPPSSDQNGELALRHQRIRTALGGVGSSVFSGSLTSFLGILALGFSNHVILTVFFKFFFSVFLLAMFHGLCVLPVLLSFVKIKKPAAVDGGAKSRPHLH